MGKAKKALAIAVVLLVGLAVAGAAYLAKLLGHRFYVVTGHATFSPSAAAHARVPALVCTGHGGPLESSGVYGFPLGYTDGTARVFCSIPQADQVLEYEESVYYGSLPREMHVYVWLEHRPELADACRASATSVITIERQRLLTDAGNGMCSHPERSGSLGYAVTFRTEVPGDRETRHIEVKPKGYP